MKKNLIGLLHIITLLLLGGSLFLLNYLVCSITKWFFNNDIITIGVGAVVAIIISVLVIFFKMKAIIFRLGMNKLIFSGTEEEKGLIRMYLYYYAVMLEVGLVLGIIGLAGTVSSVLESWDRFDTTPVLGGFFFAIIVVAVADIFTMDLVEHKYFDSSRMFHRYFPPR